MMPEGGYKIRNQAEIHFVSFAVVEWIDVFIRKEYIDIIIDSLKFCQTSKQLQVHGWCIMTSHLRLLLSSDIRNLSGTLRDFKKFTTNKIIQAIVENKKESRREWMIEIFRKAGKENSRNTNYQFWQQDNQPKECYSPAFTVQKLDYIHNNPVVAGIVDHPWEYVYSSARDYYFQTHCGLLKVAFI